MFVDKQGQVFPVERVDVEQQSRVLNGPEAQRDVFSFQRHVGVNGGRQGSAVPAQFIGLLQGVGDGRGRLKAGWNLWKLESYIFGNMLVGFLESKMRRLKHTPAAG